MIGKGVAWVVNQCWTSAAKFEGEFWNDVEQMKHLYGDGKINMNALASDDVNTVERSVVTVVLL